MGQAFITRRGGGVGNIYTADHFSLEMDKNWNTTRTYFDLTGVTFSKLPKNLSLTIQANLKQTTGTGSRSALVSLDFSVVDGVCIDAPTRVSSGQAMEPVPFSISLVNGNIRFSCTTYTLSSGETRSNHIHSNGGSQQKIISAFVLE